MLGDHRAAVRQGEQALELLRTIHDRGSDAAATWDTLGYAHLRLGELAAAAGCYRQAVEPDGHSRS